MCSLRSTACTARHMLERVTDIFSSNPLPPSSTGDLKKVIICPGSLDFVNSVGQHRFFSSSCWPFWVHYQWLCLEGVKIHLILSLFISPNSCATGAKDAFQIASASFQMHCGQTKSASVNGLEKTISVIPVLLEVPLSKVSEDRMSDSSGEENGNEPISSDTAPVQIYDENHSIRLLVCCEASRPVCFKTLSGL